jgi:hypothetical protein
MRGVHVDRDNRVTPELLQRRDLAEDGLPAGVEVPAARRRVEGDVVADRAGSGLRSHLIPAVAERHWARQSVPPVRPVRQVPERRRELDLQPALVRVEPDRLVAPEALLLTVGGKEQAGGLPLCPPLLLGQVGGGQVGPLAQQRPPAPGHRRRPRFDPPLGLGNARLQRPQSKVLGVPLCRGRVSACLPGPATCGDGEPGLDPGDPAAQARRLGTQVLPGQPVLVLTGPGDRPRPARRRLNGQRPLAHRPGRRLPPGVHLSFRAPHRQVPPGQPPQVPPGRPQHRLVFRRYPQPGPHPGPRRGSRHERCCNLS